MLSGALISIEQAHQSHVTDVLHFSPEIVLSSSKDGTIRVWKIQGTTASLDQVSTDNLFSTYSTTGKKMQILFLDLSMVNGMKVLSAGTNDNRVLFFLGDQMQYNSLVLT